MCDMRMGCFGVRTKWTDGERKIRHVFRKAGPIGITRPETPAGKSNVPVVTAGRLYFSGCPALSEWIGARQSGSGRPSASEFGGIQKKIQGRSAVQEQALRPPGDQKD